MTSNLDLQANAISTELPVDSACGSVTGYGLVFVKAGASLSVHTPSSSSGCTGVTGQAHGYPGVAVFSRSTGQNAVIATGGQFLCTFSGSIYNAGDYVQAAKGSSAGTCTDSNTPASSAPPTGAQVIGILVSTTPIPTTSEYMVLIKPAF